MADPKRGSWLALGICTALLMLFSGSQKLAYAQPSPPAKNSPAAIRQYREAVAFQNRAVYDLAADEWQKFLEKHPQDPLALQARHYLGVCKLQLKHYDDASAAMEAVLKADPKSDLAEDSYLYLGLAHYGAGQAGKTDRYPKAIEALQKMIATFPAGKQTGKGLYYLGDSLYSQGKKDEAIKEYAKSLEKESIGNLRPDVTYALGVAQQELGQTAEAGATYDRFLKENAEHPLRAEVTLRRGEVYFTAKDFANAAKWFAQAAASKDFELADRALSRQAASQYELKNYAEAAALYTSLPAKYPKSQYATPARLAAGTSYLLAGKNDEAIKWLQEALTAGGATAPEAAHWLARAQLKQKRPDEALKIIQQVLPQAGDNAFVPNLMMDQADALSEQQGKQKEALALYIAVAQKYPQHVVAPQSLYLAGFTAFGLGDYPAARQHADALAKQFPNDPLGLEAKYIAAEASVQLAKYDEAEKLYDELLAKGANHADADRWKVRRALALFLAKKYAEAQKSLEPIVGQLKSPELVAEAQYLLGSCYYELKQYDSAIKALNAAIAAGPKWRQADDTLLALAAAQRQQNHFPEAVAAVRKMLAEFPQSKLVDRAHFRLAEYAYASGDYAIAGTEYRYVIDHEPNGPLVEDAQYGLGWTQLSSKDYKSAVESFGKLIDKNPTSPIAVRARYARGMARQQLQQYDAAMEDVQAFLKSNVSGNEKSDAEYVAGLCLVGLKQNGPAIEKFRGILKENPGYSGADKVLYELAWALVSENKGGEAAGLFSQLAEKYPDSPLAAESLFRVGDFLYQNKDYEKASKAYFASGKKTGTGELGEKATHKLAWAYYQLADYDKAYRGFHFQAGKYPQGELAADALFMAAESLYKQNKYEAASTAYQASLASRPKNKDYQALALLHAAQSLAAQKKWAEALPLVVEAQKQFPDVPYLAEIYYEQARAQQNLSKSDEAINLYEEAASRSDGVIGARSRYKMGEIFFEKKNYKDAVRNFLKVAYGYEQVQPADEIATLHANASYEAGRSYEELKIPEFAKRSYKEVVDKYPKSDKAPLAKSRIEALK